MGVLMLVGISVSNSVLLVQFADEKRAEGVPTREAMMLATRTRLRPILMTTLATVGGLLPLALHRNPGDEMNLPLARAVIGGLLGSMLLTLFAIPALYTLLKPAGPGAPPEATEPTTAPEEA
jgi:multidrug efflux pump subunit AcrB